LRFGRYRSEKPKSLIMTEQQQKKKKAGLVRRVFKWIGLSFLVLLLIAAVFFQAPWKVITLLAIVLAACTVLPKPFRKWFWLSACAIVIALIIWVLLPEDNESWRPYTFDKELAKLETEYSIPDEENTAFAYDAIFENLDIDSNQPEFFIKSKPSSKEGPWLSKDHPEIAEWLKGHQSTIEKLIQTSKNDKCRFLPISADLMSYSKYIEHLPKIRQSTFLLISASNNDLAEARIDAALDKYFCVIRMANHLYQQPVMIAFMVGFAIEHIAFEQLNRFVIEGQPSEKQVQLIANSIKGPKNNWGPDWQKIMDFEKLYVKNMLCGMVYQANSEGKTRLSRGSLALTIGQSQQHFPAGNYSRRKCAKLGLIYVWLYVPSAPEKIGRIVDESYAKYYAMAEPEYDWSKEPNYVRRLWKFNYRAGIKFLTGINEPTYYSVHERYFRNLTLRRGLWLLTAIKQYEIEHGTWPDNLNAIKSSVPANAFIDPANGNEFEYENHGERFSLFGETINIWPK